MTDGEFLQRARLDLGVTFRLARDSDLDAMEWFGLYTQHREIIRSTFAMQQRGDGAMVLALVGGFPAAQAWLDFARKRARGRATVWAVRVLPPFRRAGLGTRLMRVAEDLARDRGFAETELGVDRDNSTALPFYHRLGYRHVGEETGRYSYRSPEGTLVHVPIDQWIFRKALRVTAPEEARARSGTASPLMPGA